MKEQSTERVVESRPVWEGLEAFARQGVQDLPSPRVRPGPLWPLPGRPAAR